MKQLQTEGGTDPAFDPEMLFIALLAVVTFATAIPQVVELATGLRPGDPKFAKRWSAFLQTLAARLAKQ